MRLWAVCLLLVSCSTATSTGTEQCSNGRDDDGDSKTDCADPDCFPEPTCCVDQCEDGLVLCDDMGVRTCQRNAVTGCRELSSPAACSGGQVCSGGACVVTCTNRCALGERQCIGAGASAQCQTLASGCRDWVVSAVCANDMLCSAGSCAPISSCTSVCTAGDQRCTATGLQQTCVVRGNGCTDWAFPSGPCSTGAGGGSGGSAGGGSGGAGGAGGSGGSGGGAGGAGGTGGSGGGTGGSGGSGGSGGTGGSGGAGGGFVIPPGTWVVPAGGLSADEGIHLALTSDYRVAVTGTYASATATFGRLTPTEKSLSSSGNGYGQLFLAYYQLDGGFIDARGYPDQSFGSTPSGVAALGGGDVALLGTFSRGVTLAPGLTLDSGVGTDLFVARMRSDAGVAWVRTGGSTTFSIDARSPPWAHAGGVSICADGSGYMQVGHGLPNEFAFDAGNGRVPYAARFNDTGDLLFGRSAVPSGTGNASACAGDSTGAVYIGGIFSGTIRFYTSTGGLFPLTTQALGFAGFIAKLDAQGHVLWAQSVEPVGSATVTQLAVSPTGKLIVAGYYGSTTVIGGRTLPDPSGTSQDENYVAQFDSNGTLEWVVTLIGTVDDYVRGVSVGPQGDVAVGGWFDSPSLSFGTTSGDGGVLSKSGTEAAGFVAAYSSTGQFRWARRIVGPEAADVRAVLVIDDGSVIATGAFRGTATFQLTQTTTRMLTTTSGAGTVPDIFVGRFGP